ncbi:MAG: excisionase family DNA-binding protein [Dehalococcoidia bacterium]
MSTSRNREKTKQGTQKYVRTSLLTVREAGRLLNVADYTLRRWDAQGTLKAYRIGPRGDRRFRQEDVAALLFKQTRELDAHSAKLSRH